MKNPENWMSDIIQNMSTLLETPMPEDIKKDLLEIIADLKDQDPHQYWGERGIDY